MGLNKLEGTVCSVWIELLCSRASELSDNTISIGVGAYQLTLELSSSIDVSPPFSNFLIGVKDSSTFGVKGKICLISYSSSFVSFNC